jgi:hypothetical protein
MPREHATKVPTLSEKDSRAQTVSDPWSDQYTISYIQKLHFEQYIYSLSKTFQFSSLDQFRTRSQGFRSVPNRERNRRSGPGLYPEPEPKFGVRPGPVRVRTEVQNRTFPSLVLSHISQETVK